MNVTQQHSFDCSMRKWIDTEVQSSANSATTGKSNSDTGEEQHCVSSPTTTISLSEATNQNNSSCASTPKDSGLKAPEGSSKSYAMDDLLRNDHTSTPLPSRKQKRKQTNPTQKLPEDWRNAGPPRLPDEEFITEFSRSTTDALTRALSKRARLVENGSAGDLQDLVRKVVESSLENMSANRNPSQNSFPGPESINEEIEVEEEETEQPMRSTEEPPDITQNEHATELVREPPVNLPLPPGFESTIPQPQDLLGSVAGNSGNPLIPNEEFFQFLRRQMEILSGPNRNHENPPTPIRPETLLEMARLFPPLPPPPPPPPLNVPEPDAQQTEALALVVNRNPSPPQGQQFESPRGGFDGNMMLFSQRKKRTKVTDTRLVPPKLPEPSLGPVNPFSPPNMAEPVGNVPMHSQAPISGPSRQQPGVNPAFIAEMLRNIPLLNNHPMPPPPLATNMPPLRIPQMEMNSLTMPLPQHHNDDHLPHHSNAYFGDPAHTPNMMEANPIRRNRSITGRRVTNAGNSSSSSLSVYGFNGKGFHNSGSPQDDSSGFSPGHFHGLSKSSSPTTTLTPIHLRKAKLMFFYTRYPNSNLLKAYFIDVHFEKQNTAQLVKWFSNFREFYYIQMEKFARVEVEKGVRNAERISVPVESDLYRTLVQHYNRNQQLEVPEDFRKVVERTLQEFFKALSEKKDTEQSWKKPIYKIISRLDQPIPEFFKDPEWMKQLAEG